MKVEKVLKLIQTHDCYAFVRVSDEDQMLILQSKDELDFQLKMLPSDTEIKAFINNSNQLIVGW